MTASLRQALEVSTYLVVARDDGAHAALERFIVVIRWSLADLDRRPACDTGRAISGDETSGRVKRTVLRRSVRSRPILATTCADAAKAPGEGFVPPQDERPIHVFASTL